MMLILVTAALSVLVAVLAIATWRLARAERHRSDARVAALGAAIDDTHPGPSVRTSAAAPSLQDIGMSAFAPETVPANRAPAFAAAGGLLVLFAAIGLFALGRDDAPRPEPRAATIGAGIELLSMRHALDGNSLVVSGLVRNRSDRSTPALTAVITALDRGGQIVGRGESTLDASVLLPGKETSFRVVVPDVHGLGRFRVGFASGGRLIPHTDRRGELRHGTLSAARRNY